MRQNHLRPKGQRYAKELISYKCVQKILNICGELSGKVELCLVTLSISFLKRSIEDTEDFGQNVIVL